MSIWNRLVISSLSSATHGMEKFRGEQKNVIRFRDFLFYQYHFVVGLLQGLMINAYESGSNSLGAGIFSRDLTKTKSLQCRNFTWALHMEKSISPLSIPRPLGGRGCK